MLEDFIKSVMGDKNARGVQGRSHLFQYLPSSQADLPPRKMSVININELDVHLDLLDYVT